MPSSYQSIFLGCKKTNARVIHLAHNAFRITHVSKDNPTYPVDKPWVRDIFIGGEVKTSDFEDWEFHTGEGCLSINNLQGYFSFRELGTSILTKQQKTDFSIAIEKDELFYGFGERFDAFGRTSGKISMFNQESPAFLQSHRTYSNIPVFLSSRGYLFFSLTACAGKWKIDPQSGHLSITNPGSEIDYVLIFGKDYKEILSTYTGLTGRPPLLPRWAFGLWVTSFPQEDQTRTIAFLKEHRRRHIPLDAVILDYHWEEKFHNFRWRKKIFPSPDIFIKNLKALNVHLGLILTPFINNKNNYPLKLFWVLIDKAISKSTLWDDERALEEYSDGKKKGVYAHPNAAWWFGKGGMLDFTNPDSKKWWGEKLISHYRKGVDFFKNDDGEYLPPSSTSAMGLDSKEYHNLYGFYYGKTMYEQQLDLSSRRPMIYARSVWAGSQRFPAMFLGDQIPDFNNIRHTINAGLNMSLLGFSYWTADCFGLNGKTNPEIHMRYAQWALMVPISRYFVRPEKTDKTRFPWSHSLEVEQNFRKYISLRYRLLPYYVNLAWQSWLHGWPIMRPMLFEFPEDKNTRKISDQIFLGDQLLLAPVLKKGVHGRKIYLPKGDWFDYWTDQRYEGEQWIEKETPPDVMPIFVKAGSILPMMDARESIPDAIQFDPLYFHIWLGNDAEFNYYEDDGISSQYQNNQYSKIIVTVKKETNRINIRFKPELVENNKELIRRKLILILHHANKPEMIKVNNQIFDNWKFDQSLNLITIEMQYLLKEELDFVI